MSESLLSSAPLPNPGEPAKPCPQAYARPALSRSKKLCFLFVAASLLFLTIFAVAEVVARAKGYRPYTPPRIDIRVEPGGKFYTLRPSGGYAQLPGAFKITLPDGFHFKVTHDTNGLRITRPLRAASPEPKPAIWIMGCSLTHGWSLNDHETYPWLVQQALPEYEIVNGGIEGYGTLQSRIQFQEMLPHRPKPRVVVLAYGTFQDFRNTFLRLRQKSIAPLNKLGPMEQPYARLTRSGDLDYFMAPTVYREFPLMRASAFVHFTEERYNQLEAQTAKSHLVSAELIRRFASFCESEQIRFVLAGISSDAGSMLAYARAQGISTVDISVVLALPGNTNAPHDNHPSAAANRVYAEKLTAFLSREVLGGETRSAPRPASTGRASL